MSLTDYTAKPEPKINLKSALRRMRSIWLSGAVSRFDVRLSEILDCSLEHAESVRKSWVNMGFLAYDKRGLLCWRNGGF